MLKNPNYLRPFFTFYGGKWKLAPNYGRPRYNTIIELFAGSAGYSLNYYQREVILIEKDPEIYYVWKYLLSSCAKDIYNLPEITDETDLLSLDIERGAKNLIGFWCGRGLAKPRTKLTGWGKHGKYEKQYWGAHVKERIANQIEYIKHWKVIYASAFGVIDKFNTRPVTWFIDPPYQMCGGHRYVFGSHKLDYKSLASHISLLHGQIIVCEGELASWLPFEHLINGTAQNGNSFKEMVYRREQS